MGLAPYGEPKFLKLIKENLASHDGSGSVVLNMKYFDFESGNKMFNKRFEELLGSKSATPDQSTDQFFMDVASSIQFFTEEVVLGAARFAKEITGSSNLCLAGGVALNCVANGKILNSDIFKDIWIQPAAGDAGGAVGAALGAYYSMLGQPRTVQSQDAMKGSYLGPEYSPSEIESRLRAAGAIFTSVSPAEMIDATAQALAQGKAVGWHQGRMEFGPRALGGRSIIADPRSPAVQKQLNLKVKYRESFRPFAPSVLREDVSQWFDIDVDSPYMLLVADVVKSRQLPMTAEQEQLFGIDKLNVPRSEIPAVTHVDYSARIQTVHKETNPLYYALISTFKELTGCPVLVNTSFNVRGEPIVCTPEDAFNCLMGTEIEFLVVGNCLMRKEDQNPALIKDYKNAYELD